MKSLFNDKKGEKTKLSEIVSIKGGKLETQRAKKNGKYPFYICSKEPLRIDFADYNQEAVLVAGTGAVYSFYVNGKFNARQKVHILSKKENIKIEMKLLYYIINNNLDYFRNNQAGGALKNIDQEGVLNFEFSIPENPDKILKIAENLEKDIENSVLKIKKLELLKKGLLNKLL